MGILSVLIGFAMGGYRQKFIFLLLAFIPIGGLNLIYSIQNNPSLNPIDSNEKYGGATAAVLFPLIIGSIFYYFGRFASRKTSSNTSLHSLYKYRYLTWVLYFIINALVIAGLYFTVKLVYPPR